MAEETPKIADAGAAGWVGYTMALVMAWVYLAGYVDATAGIYMAGICVGCLIAYSYAAITQLKLGNVVGGVTWAYFGAFFAGASAFNYLVGWLNARYAWEADVRIQGWMWIVLGILLIMETPIFMKYSNAAAGISVVAADIGIVALSFVFWGKGGTALVDVSAWAFFVAAIGGILNAGNGILEGVGWKIPLGPPVVPSRTATPVPEQEATY